MSNIYDSANALSRGLRELPEYKAVKDYYITSTQVLQRNGFHILLLV